MLFKKMGRELRMGRKMVERYRDNYSKCPSPRWIFLVNSGLLKVPNSISDVIIWFLKQYFGKSSLISGNFLIFIDPLLTYKIEQKTRGYMRE